MADHSQVRGKERLFDSFAPRKFEKIRNKIAYQRRFGGRHRLNYINVNS